MTSLQTQALVNTYQLFKSHAATWDLNTKYSEGAKWAFEHAAERMLHVCKMCDIEIFPLAITPEMEKEAANVE